MMQAGRTFFRSFRRDNSRGIYSLSTALYRNFFLYPRWIYQRCVVTFDLYPLTATETRKSGEESARRPVDRRRTLREEVVA